MFRGKWGIFLVALIEGHETDPCLEGLAKKEDLKSAHVMRVEAVPTGSLVAGSKYSAGKP